MALGDFGNPGNITIEAGNVRLLNGGRITAETASGQGAEISMNIDQTLLLERTLTTPPVNDLPNGECSTCNLISAAARREVIGEDPLEGDTVGSIVTGGNISIELLNISARLEDNSDIVATAEGGSNGGNVTVTGPNGGPLYVDLSTMFNQDEGRTPESDLDASSELGTPGSTEVANTQSTPETPVLDPIDPTNLVDQRCDLLARRQDDISAFTVTGRGGLPLAPDEQLDGNDLLEDLGPLGIPQSEDNTIDPASTTPSQLSVPEIITEPQGWTITADGRLLLYGNAGNAQSWLNTGCHASTS